MSLEYTWTRNDLKKKLKKKRVIPNIVFSVIGVVLYFYLTYYGLVGNIFDKGILLIGFLVYFTILEIILFLMTHLYVYGRLKVNDRRTSKAYGTYYIVADEKGIKSTINDTVIEYEWNKISKFKHNKKWFFRATKKDRLGLLFNSEVLGEDKYTKLLSYVSKKINES
jgi:hypothetical protein